MCFQAEKNGKEKEKWFYDVVDVGRARVEGSTWGEEREGEKQVDVGEEERGKWHVRAPLGERGR